MDLISESTTDSDKSSVLSRPMSNNYQICRQKKIVDKKKLSTLVKIVNIPIIVDKIFEVML